MVVPAVIAGIDEAGRGALAGPVVAGACVLSSVPLFRRKTSFINWSPSRRKQDQDVLIADSKALSPLQRERAFEWISNYCYVGVGIVSQEVIEQEGILAANERAMQLALERVRQFIQPTFLLVDGRDHFWFDLPHASVIRGDQTEACIAAASILAKVTRDRIMRKWGALIPSYGFETNKGYGTDEHCERIRKHGACALHRRSFLSRILI
jgi:ribonuclease HII